MESRLFHRELRTDHKPNGRADLQVCPTIRFMVRAQFPMEQAAFHEPTPSPLPGGEPATGASNEAPLLGGAGGGFMARAQFLFGTGGFP